MPAANPLAIFASGLNAVGMSWMAVGSIASSSYGEFRTTGDVDLIAWIQLRQAQLFSAAFPENDFYCPPADVIALEAQRPERGHFNVIHHATMFKADIYLPTAGTFERWALRHRRKLFVGLEPVWIAPPEYVIMGKLEFLREGGSEKHIRDIAGMLEV